MLITCQPTVPPISHLTDAALPDHHTTPPSTHHLPVAPRYGAIPVVRATGGLRDTVFDLDNDKARAAWEMEGSTDWQADGVDATNGFSFDVGREGRRTAISLARAGWGVAGSAGQFTSGAQRSRSLWAGP